MESFSPSSHESSTAKTLRCEEGNTDLWSVFIMKDDKNIIEDGRNMVEDGRNRYAGGIFIKVVELFIS
ncbi:MAG: hypothetical protein A2W84_14245 [Bacteroidetes bacterium GWC2_40_13]|nr:MAG: hypothetical protein A2W84_14245 [Bacteroidetes bacterium GWC2_40_13]HCC31409.1 hypothetical protein [Marinilabiliales bacterium]